jgi:hypothetical protein
MKKILGSILLAAGLLAATIPAQAQVAGLYPVLMSTAPTNGTGQSIVFPANSTNQVFVYTLTNGVANGVIVTNNYGNPGTATNLALNITSYDYVGLTWGFTGTATSTNSLLIYKSFDNGANYETTASFQYLNIAPGAAGWVTNASLDVHGVSTLAFVVKSSGTTAGTNNVLEVNLKSPQLFVTPPGNYGKTPGTPITVPNFP